MGARVFDPPHHRASAFWHHVARGEGCWEWLGERSIHGYGRFRLHAKHSAPAHRVAYSLIHNVTLSGGVVVRHTCDNRACVRPDHLLLGTQTDNVRDMIDRGRNKNTSHYLAQFAGVEGACECGHTQDQHIPVGRFGSVVFHGCVERITATRCSCRLFRQATAPGRSAA